MPLFMSRKKLSEEYGIPKKAVKIYYYGRYSKKLGSKIYYWEDDDKIFFNDIKTNTNIIINKDDVISFNTIGEYKETQKISGGKVKGGGVSLGGAVVGGAIAGPVGAIIGGRKKVKSKPIKTETVVTDTRKVVLCFKENEIREQMLLGYYIYEKLCTICPDKNADTYKVIEQKENAGIEDIPTQIKKLADLKEQGILTEEEFTQKKTELLGKM